jgi:hypothetical protein
MLEDSTVPAEVGAVVTAAVDDDLLLRVWSRTQRPVLGPPSCPARSLRIRGRCGRCGRRGTTTAT